jgi:hypothetical protein
MMHPARYDTKMLRTAGLENKAEPEHWRVPSGYSVDREIRVRVMRDGPVPLLDVRVFARSPAEVSNGAEAFHATGAGVACELQFLPVLLEALDKARAAA